LPSTTTITTVVATTSSTTIAVNCPEVTEICTDADATFPIPIVNLSEDGSQRPIINGIFDSNEYSSFLELPMFNGGKNGETGSPLDKEGRIGTAYLAYDYSNGIVCGSAVLDSTFLNDPPTSGIQVQESEEDSWIQFGAGGATKLFQGTADAFQYVRKPGDSDFIIGYEGCWTIDRDDPKMENVLNNVVQVHFNRGSGETTSTGKAAADGRLVCLTPTCPTTTTTTEATTTTTTSNNPSASPTKNPTASPSENPTGRPSKKPTASPTKNPTQAPSGKPTPAPSVEPTVSPTAAPTAQTVSPTATLTASPTAKPTTIPTSEPTNAPTEVSHK
jgi:hypothetical protein